jgi:hypothetical protein
LQEFAMSLLYPHRAKPFKGLSAFKEISEDTTPSQAAVVLLLGHQIRGGDAPLRARAAAQKRKGFVADEPQTAFPVPRLRGVEGPMAFDDSRDRLKKRYAYTTRQRGVGADGYARYESVYRDTAQQLFAKPVAANAADLFALCLDHPKALVRIAAAIASLRLTTRPQQNVKVMLEGLKSTDRLERDLAATGLARHYPDHPALARLSRGKTAARVKRPRQTAMLVHGTWASDAAWYQPGGNFHQHINALRPDLYGAADFFKWSGGWSDGARLDGATALKQWVESRNESGLDLIGHSHGANIMLKATELGLRIGKAVLLSCPVHVDKYFPNFANVQAPLFAVRVHMDLVVLADGGGQRFSHPQIKEITLPIWFDHGASHEPQVWQDNNVAQKIAL